MRIGAIIQARMTSRRLPGKVLREIAGKPALAYVVDSVARCHRLDALVVATSGDASDDAIARFCVERDIACYRGPLEDVAERMAGAARAQALDAFFRVCGDSPLLDHRLLNTALEVYGAGDYDLVTNVLPRSYPAGESVELLRVAAFAAARDMTPEDREHVTPYFYRFTDRFRIGRFSAPEPWQDARLVLDTEDDLAVIEDIVSRMRRPHWDYTVAELLSMHPRPRVPSRS